MQFFICSFQDVLKAKYSLCSAFRKEQAYRNWAEISKGIAKPVSHISAQIDTLGEDDVGGWVNAVSERQRMVQVLYTARLVWQPPAFHWERPKARLDLCPATPPHPTWGIEPHSVKPGYWRAKHSTALKCVGNPWAKHESRFTCFSLYGF